MMADSRLKGYEYEFVESVKDDHTCPICFFPIREALQISNCGHVFCKSCLDYWIGSCSETEAKCPNDNETLIVGNTFLDRRLDREITSLKVYCENHSSGCNEPIELREYDKHCSTCPYKMVDCPLNCSLKVMDRLIPKHVKFDCARRIVQCELCELTMEHQHTEEHGQNCLLREVECRFCRRPVIFKEMEAHEAICLYYPTYCLFAPIGCSNKIERRFLKDHHEQSTEKHLNQLTLAALQLYEEGDFVPEKVPNVMYELPVSLMDKFAKKKGHSVVLSLEKSMKAVEESIESLKNDNKELQKEVSKVTEDNGALKAENVELKKNMKELMESHQKLERRFPTIWVARGTIHKGKTETKT